MIVTNNRKRWLLGGGAVAMGLLASSFVGEPDLTAQQPSGWSPSIVTLPSPAGINSGEPQLTVSDRGVLLSWVEHNGPKATLRYAERTRAGWTEPRTIASGDDWTINAIDVPSVLRLADGTLAAQWLQKGGSGMHANEVRLSYSNDDGRSWAAPFAPYREGAHKERLFASLFQMPGAGLGLIWLEGGTMPAATGTGTAATSAQNHPTGADHSQHQPGAQRGRGHEGHEGRGGLGGSGTMTLRFASFDKAWKLTTEMPIDLRVCECCSTAAVVTSEGVLAAYRDRSDDEIRDIYVSRFTQGRWSPPAVVHADNWRIQACPINGPALSARGANVAAAWYTVKQDQGHSYVAFSRDAGRSFGQPTRLDDRASLGRVDVELLPDGSALATWIEVADGGSQFRARRVAADGTRSAPVTLAAGVAGGRGGSSSRVAQHGDELVFTWSEGTGSALQVRTAIARLPPGQTR